MGRESIERKEPVLRIAVNTTRTDTSRIDTTLLDIEKKKQQSRDTRSLKPLFTFFFNKEAMNHFELSLYGWVSPHKITEVRVVLDCLCGSNQTPLLEHETIIRSGKWHSVQQQPLVSHTRSQATRTCA